MSDYAMTESELALFYNRVCNDPMANEVMRHIRELRTDADFWRKRFERCSDSYMARLQDLEAKVLKLEAEK